VFNETLTLRMETGGLLRVRSGDVLQKTGSGGIFVSTDPGVDQPRVDAGEIVPTGPMPGSRGIEPPPDSEAEALERRAIEACGLTREAFAALGRELPGARRPVVVPVTLGEPPCAAELRPGSDVALRIRFALPAGSYATVLLQALAALDPADPVVTFSSSAALPSPS
jgi:tRNA pseudouridine13 synthase